MKNAEEQRDQDDPTIPGALATFAIQAGLTGSIAALKRESRYKALSMILRTTSMGPAINPLNTTRLILMDTMPS